MVKLSPNPGPTTFAGLTEKADALETGLTMTWSTTLADLVGILGSIQTMFARIYAVLHEVPTAALDRALAALVADVGIGRRGLTASTNRVGLENG